MRIVFRAHPQLGHLYPLMPLAEAARAAGHDVIFPTAGPFLDRLAELGYRSIKAGVMLEDALQRRFGARAVALVVDGETAWELVGEFFAEAAVPAAKDLRDLLPHLGVDLVVYENTDLGAAAAAAAVGVPSIGVAITRSLDPHIGHMLYGQSLEELQATFGAVSRPDDRLVDTYPPTAQRREYLDDPRRVPMRAVPWSEPSLPLPTWVGTHERRLVFMTLGSVTESVERRRQIIDGLATVDADIVVAAGVADVVELADLPDNVHVDAFVHQANLLPHVDVIIHHGGCGTTTGAWVHAVPQLVVPDGADRFINADAVVASGTGIALDTTNPDLIEKAVHSLLEDAAYVRTARAVRHEIMQMPDPAMVISDLTDQDGQRR